CAVRARHAGLRWPPGFFRRLSYLVTHLPVRPGAAMAAGQRTADGADILKNGEIADDNRVAGRTVLRPHQHGAALPVRTDEFDDLLPGTRIRDTADIDAVVPVRIGDERALKGRTVVTIPIETAILKRRGEDEQGVFHGAL